MNYNLDITNNSTNHNDYFHQIMGVRQLKSINLQDGTEGYENHRIVRFLMHRRRFKSQSFLNRTTIRNRPRKLL